MFLLESYQFSNTQKKLKKTFNNGCIVEFLLQKVKKKRCKSQKLQKSSMCILCTEEKNLYDFIPEQNNVCHNLLLA